MLHASECTVLLEAVITRTEFFPSDSRCHRVSSTSISTTTCTGARAAAQDPNLRTSRDFSHTKAATAKRRTRASAAKPTLATAPQSLGLRAFFSTPGPDVRTHLYRSSSPSRGPKIANVQGFLPHQTSHSQKLDPCLSGQAYPRNSPTEPGA